MVELGESLSEIEPIGRTSRKFIEIAKVHEMKFQEYTPDQSNERGLVFSTWIADVVNALLDEIELTSQTQTIDTEHNKFLVNEILMSRIDRTLEPQEEQKGSGSEDITEAVVKSRYGLSEIRTMLLQLENYVLGRKRDILGEEA